MRQQRRFRTSGSPPRGLGLPRRQPPHLPSLMSGSAPAPRSLTVRSRGCGVDGAGMATQKLRLVCVVGVLCTAKLGHSRIMSPWRSRCPSSTDSSRHCSGRRWRRPADFRGPLVGATACPRALHPTGAFRQQRQEPPCPRIEARGAYDVAFVDWASLGLRATLSWLTGTLGCLETSHRAPDLPACEPWWGGRGPLAVLPVHAKAWRDGYRSGADIPPLD